VISVISTCGRFLSVIGMHRAVCRHCPIRVAYTIAEFVPLFVLSVGVVAVLEVHVILSLLNALRWRYIGWDLGTFNLCRTLGRKCDWTGHGLDDPRPCNGCLSTGCPNFVQRGPLFLAMPYADHLEPQLRKAIRDDLNGSPPRAKGRSGMEILRAMNAFRQLKGASPITEGLFESIDRRLREFAHRDKSWTATDYKRWLWDFYVYEGVIVDHEAIPDSVEHFTRTVDLYFKRPNVEERDILGICSAFYAYKKSIIDSSKVVDKYQMIIERRIATASFLFVNEIHRNRRFVNREDDAIFEYFDGCIFPRRRSYMLITREIDYGTPKCAILYSPLKRAETIVQMLGSSVEAAEGPGNINFLKSNIFFERINSQWDRDKIMDATDHIPVEQFRVERPDIYGILYGDQ
jgi:hypothetical protein